MADSSYALGRFTAMSARSAAAVIATYSTSFTLASRMLSPRIRRDIEALYAMVRIADEIVDGAASAAGCTPAEVAAILDDYEVRVLRCLDHPFHTDPVLHAFGGTARSCGFRREHITAFFASMRRDLSQVTYDPTQLDAYIYGSAEVIGLLCLAIFLRDADPTPAERDSMEEGARRLGAAFQKVNFLRDMAEDSARLGRAYLPQLSDQARAGLLAEIRADLQAARACIPLLPLGARAGVAAATDLYSALVDRLEAASLTELNQGRIRVPAINKAGLAARSVIREVLRK